MSGLWRRGKMWLMDNYDDIDVDEVVRSPARLVDQLGAGAAK